MEIIGKIIENIYTNISQGISENMLNQLYEETIINIVVFIIGTIFALLKVVFPEWDFLSKIKGRKKLLGRIVKSDWRELFRKVLYLIGELSILLIYYLLLIILLYGIYVCFLIRDLLSSDVAAYSIFTIIISIIMFLLWEQKKGTIKHAKLPVLLSVTIGCLWGAIAFFLDANIYLVVSVVLSAFWVAIIRIGCYKYSKQNYYNHIILRFVRIVRYSVLPIVMVNDIRIEGYGLTENLMSIWFFLWLIEYIGTLFFTENTYINVTLHTTMGDMDTIKPITLYGGSKIKCITTEGKKVTIKKSKVNSITYTIKKRRWDKAKKISYTLKNQEPCQCDGCIQLTDSWIKLYEFTDDSVAVKIIDGNEVDVMVEG